MILKILLNDDDMIIDMLSNKNHNPKSNSNWITYIIAANSLDFTTQSYIDASKNVTKF